VHLRRRRVAIVGAQLEAAEELRDEAVGLRTRESSEQMGQGVSFESQARTQPTALSIISAIDSCGQPW